MSAQRSERTQTVLSYDNTHVSAVKKTGDKMQNERKPKFSIFATEYGPGAGRVFRTSVPKNHTTPVPLSNDFARVRLQIWTETPLKRRVAKSVYSVSNAPLKITHNYIVGRLMCVPAEQTPVQLNSYCRINTRVITRACRLRSSNESRKFDRRMTIICLNRMTSKVKLTVCTPHSTRENQVNLEIN